MARARKKNGPFSFLTEKRETYRRDVAGERADRQRAAKVKAADEKAHAKAMAEHMRDIQEGYSYDMGARHKREGKKPHPEQSVTVGSQWLSKEKLRPIARREYMKGYRENPAVSGAQYRLAQAVLSGSAREVGMSKKAAQEIIDRTPASKRREFSKRNPEDAAGALAEAFLGRPAKTATEFRKTIHYHSVLTGLAPLMEIKVWVDDRHIRAIKFDKEKAWLGSAESGEQLYVEGDDLDIDLEPFGITGHAAQKDLIRIGDVYSVTYFTAKDHLGKPDKIPGPYEHIFAEHDEEEPELIYDRLNQEPQFAGGEYHIPIDIDGKYSSGINN